MRTHILSLTFFGALTSLTGCLDADVRRGDRALGSGAYREAIAFYELARDRLPEEALPLTRLASAHRALGTTLLEADRCEEARPHFAEAESLTRVLLVDRESIYACLTRVSAPDAVLIEELQAMRAAGDARTSTQLALVRALLAERRDEEAVALRGSLAERHGLTPEDQRKLAMAFIRLRRYADARADLEVAVTHHPEDALLRLKLAEVYERGEDLVRAEQVYRDLIRDFPKNPLIHQRLSVCLKRRGDEDGAKAAMEHAQRLRGHVPPPQRDLRPLRKSRR